MSIVTTKEKLSQEQSQELLRVLEVRFEKNMNRHKDLEWPEVKAKLEANPEKLWSLNEMERTGGEPDVVGHDKKTGEYFFYDCSAESPAGRRNICYDCEGQEAPSLLIAATAMFSYPITVHPHSIAQGPSVAR